jgi:hypothetical protein
MYKDKISKAMYAWLTNRGSTKYQRDNAGRKKIRILKGEPAFLFSFLEIMSAFVATAEKQYE